MWFFQQFLPNYPDFSIQAKRAIRKSFFVEKILYIFTRSIKKLQAIQ